MCQSRTGESRIVKPMPTSNRECKAQSKPDWRRGSVKPREKKSISKKESGRTGTQLYCLGDETRPDPTHKSCKENGILNTPPHVRRRTKSRNGPQCVYSLYVTHSWYVHSVLCACNENLPILSVLITVQQGPG